MNVRTAVQVLWLTLVAVAMPVALAAVSRTVEVNAAKSFWQGTGVHVRQGDTITFSASGTVIDWRSPDRRETHSSDPNGRCDTDFLVPGAAPLGLVGKIGRHTFAIGRSRTVLAPDSGDLHLAMNETTRGGWADNSGIWEVDISGARQALCQVSARTSGWRRTHVSFRKGDLIVFKASGSVIDWRSPDGSETHSSDPNGRCDADFLVPGTAPLGLVGKVGSQTFGIGRSRTVVAPDSGELQLAMNETTRGGWADNSGAWTVEVRVERP